MRVALLVAVALAAITSACVVVDSMLAVDCVKHFAIDKSFATPNDDTALQFQLDRCQLDADACADLCRLALAATTDATQTGCHVRFGAAEATVHVTYDEPTNAAGCPGTGIGSGIGTGSGFADAGIVSPPPMFPDASLPPPPFD